MFYYKICECNCGCQTDGDWHFTYRNCECLSIECPCVVDAPGDPVTVDPAG